MKKVWLFVCLVLLAGCDAKQEVGEGAGYIKEAGGYVRSVESFAKSISDIVQEPNGKEKVKRIAREAEVMRQKAQAFNEKAYPSSLKHVHRGLVRQNHKFIDSLDIMIITVETGEKGVDKVSELVKDIQAMDFAKQLKTLLKKEEDKTP